MGRGLGSAPFLLRSLRIEDHLRAAEERDGFARRFRFHDSIPNLRRTSAMCEVSFDADAAFARGAEKVRLQLNGGEVQRALGTRDDAAIAAGAIGQSNDARGMEERVRREVMRLHVEAASDEAGARFDPFEAKVIGQEALLSFCQLLNVIWFAHPTPPILC